MTIGGAKARPVLRGHARLGLDGLRAVPGAGLITVLFAFLTRDSGSFLTVYNWRTIAVQTVIVGTAALGMTIIIIAGGIDLSVGSIVALVTVAWPSSSRKWTRSGPRRCGPGTLPCRWRCFWGSGWADFAVRSTAG